MSNKFNIPVGEGLTDEEAERLWDQIIAIADDIWETGDRDAEISIQSGQYFDNDGSSDDDVASIVYRGSAYGVITALSGLISVVCRDFDMPTDIMCAALWVYNARSERAMSEGAVTLYKDGADS